MLLTCLTLTRGRVSQTGFLLEVILVPGAPEAPEFPSIEALCWGTDPPPAPCWETGLWGPEEEEEEERWMKAISTVGSGLNQQTGR